MKSLTLLRHAKSDWANSECTGAVQRDFDRPLNDRGRRAARTVGGYMRGEGLTFDAVIASPARRVRDTLHEVERGYERALMPVFDEDVYMASSSTLMDFVRAFDAGAASVLLVGHNPGLEELALELAAQADSPLRHEVEIKYPTATLAEIALDTDRWEDTKTGRLVRFVRPRDLDPSLGPDG